MTGFAANNDRNVIPRWRLLNETVGLGELNPSLRHIPTPPPIQERHNPLAKQIAAWKKYQSIGHASDLVGSALFLNKSHEVQDAVEFLQRNQSKTSKWVKELVEQSLPNYNNHQNATPLSELTVEERAIQQIQKLKPLLRDEPQDPLTQVDLAYAYASIGLNEKASKCMIIATQLAPNNRFVLRSASCLWTNADKEEDENKAHDILVNSDRTPHDPWLLAAEIAVGNSMGIKPKFVTEARNLLGDKKFMQFHLSELASAVATIEWSHGHNKSAKKFFLQSLKEPTENSLAQAVWMSTKENFINLDQRLWLIPNVFEAKTRNFRLKKMWKQATKQCELWQLDQPFSSDPGIEGSFISIIALDDFHLAKQFAQTGLSANPNNPLLLNNLAVALINLKEFKKAKETLSKISLTEPNNTLREITKITKIATTGLLNYRTGNIKTGRQLYLSARLLAEKQSHSPHLASLATAFHAIEEHQYQGPHYHQLVDHALYLLKKHNDPIYKILVDKLGDYMPK